MNKFGCVSLWRAKSLNHEVQGVEVAWESYKTRAACLVLSGGSQLSIHCVYLPSLQAALSHVPSLLNFFVVKSVLNKSNICAGNCQT